MKYLKYFKTDADYQQYKNDGILTPNVSFVEEPTSVFYNPYAESVSRANLCDIAYWDGSSVKTVSQDEWTSDLGAPVGVVVIPSGFAPDGKARIMSLKYATSKGSATDVFEGNHMPWGTYGTDTNLTNYSKVLSTDNTNTDATSLVDSAYLPSDKFTGTVSYVDPGTQYSGTSRTMIPSPYITRDGKYEVNPEYYKELEGDNVLSDFNGMSNTESIVKLITGSFAPNASWAYNGDVPEASVQWYLPAAGELGFVVPRFNAINAAISKVGGAPINDALMLLTSSEYSAHGLWYIRMADGNVYPNGKTYYGYVRPFAIL